MQFYLQYQVEKNRVSNNSKLIKYIKKCFAYYQYLFSKYDLSLLAKEAFRKIKKSLSY